MKTIGVGPLSSRRMEGVAKHPRTMCMRVDTCAAELKDPESKENIQKATELWFSSHHFAVSLGYLKNHKHSVLQGSFQGQRRTDAARVWTWGVATRVDAGVAAIIRG